VRLAPAGLIAVSLALAAPAAGAARKAVPTPPPRVLNIVRVKVKPRAASAYATLENQIVRAYERAKAKVYWIALQSPHDSSDVLYLNLADSQESWERMSAAYQAAVKRHPELTELQDRLTKITLSTVSTLTSRRDDVDRAPKGVDFNSMRSLRLTLVEVRPGREGSFLDAIRTAPPADGSWIVYEATDTSTYALITLAATNAPHNSGSTMPRSLRRSKGIVLHVETRTYRVRPGMSHPAAAPTVATQ
jgi:hypothetical protein